MKCFNIYNPIINLREEKKSGEKVSTKLEINYYLMSRHLIPTKNEFDYIFATRR